ncbi:LacI family DNA-binding transcriptional regulator [Microbacterium rhizosphaerae]
MLARGATVGAIRAQKWIVVETPRTSLEDVASLAGVSAASASRALTGRGELSPETRRRVLEAAATLGYDRSSTPRGRPRPPDARIIELVFGRLTGAWVSRAVVGAHEQAFALGYDLVLTQERESASDDWHVRAAARHSSGVITAVVTPTAGQIDYLAEFAIPTVLLDPHGEPHRDLVTVSATNERGGFEAGRHLVERGYERFALALSPLQYRYGRARTRGFREALAAAGVDDLATVEVGWDGRISRAAVDRLVGLAEGGPVGLFALNDTMANAVVSALLRAGVRVPEDVGVVGFDGDPRPPSAPLAVTSIHQPIREMAARAIDAVDRLRRGEQIAQRRIELPTDLLRRDST